MKKKFLFLLLLCVCISGCSFSGKKKVITWYVDQDMFVNNGVTINYDEPIQNDYIEAYNHVLEEKGYDFQIEVYYYNASQYSTLDSKKGMFERIKKEHPDADVVDFYQPAIGEYEILDSYMDSELGKKLKEEIPEKIFEKNKIDGHIYGIEKMGFKYVQRAYAFQPTFYEEHEAIIEQYKEDPISLIEQLSSLYSWDENLLLTSPNGFNPSLYLDQRYVSISFEGHDSGLFVRRSDQKVVSLFDDPELLELYLRLGAYGRENAYGRELNEQQRNEIQNKNAYALTLIPYEYPQAVYENTPMDDTHVYVRYGDAFLLGGAKLGILKNSDQKEDAFTSIALMFTDKDAANAMIYGSKKTYQGDFIVDQNVEVGGSWNSFGNYLIADQAVGEPNHKKELLFSFVDQIDMNKLVNLNFSITEKTSEIDQLSAALVPALQQLSINAEGLREEQLRQKYEDLRKVCEEKQLEEIRAFLQDQLDQRKTYEAGS